MSASSLVIELRDGGFHLSWEGKLDPKRPEKLYVTPRNRLTHVQEARIARDKSAILAYIVVEEDYWVRLLQGGGSLGTASPAYHAYLQSPLWKSFRSHTIAARGNKCQDCASRIGLQVHHESYQYIAEETDEDVRVLCPACHQKADAARRAEVRSDVQDRRLNGWATKKYGDDWEYYHDREDVQDEFEGWLESRDEDY